MRPAVFHCFGRDKSGAKGTLRVMASEGWETLLAVLLGVGNLRPLWQQTGWTPFGGMCWHGPASAATLSEPLRRHLFKLWKPHGQQHQPQWLLPNQEPTVQLPTVPKREISTDDRTSGEPLGSSVDALLPKSESNASDRQGDHWVFLWLDCHIRPRKLQNLWSVLAGFSAGSYVGAAVALIACKISQSFPVHITSGAFP